MELYSLEAQVDPLAGAEYAKVALKALYACDEGVRRSLDRCGDLLIDLLFRWGMSFSYLRGRAKPADVIRSSFNFFKKVLSSSISCPKGEIREGRALEDLIFSILRKSDVRVSIDGKEYIAVVRRGRPNEGPDLFFDIYRGSITGSPEIKVLGEIKLRSNLREIQGDIEQFERYLSEYKLPLLVIAFVGDYLSEEIEIDDLLGNLKGVRMLAYPLTLFEPLILSEASDEALDTLAYLLGKDLGEDVSWQIHMLLKERVAVPQQRPTPKYRRQAEKIFDKLLKKRSPSLRLHDFKEYSDLDGENAEKLIEMLIGIGVIRRKTKRTFEILKDELRSKRDETLQVMESFLSRS